MQNMLTWQSCLFACCARNYVKKIWFLHTYVQVPPSSGSHGKQVPTFPFADFVWPTPLVTTFPVRFSLLNTAENYCLRNIFVSFHFTAHKKFRNYIQHMKGKFQIPGNMRNTIWALHFLLHHEKKYKDTSLFFTESDTSIWQPAL